MDRPLKKQRWPFKRLILWIGAPALVAVLLIMSFSGSGSTFRIDRDRVSIGTVEMGDFQDLISVQGVVEPLTTIQIDASEGGVVEEIFAEDGAQVQAGTPLLRLSNTSLTLDFMNRETQIIEQINNLRSTRISLDLTRRQVQEQLVDIEYQLTEQLRQWQIDSQLHAQQAISESEFQASVASTRYLQEKRALLADRFRTDEAYRNSQMSRIDQSIEMMERNLLAIRKNLENLVVKAPITGQLNSFDHELGQTKSRGESLGRVDVLDGFRVSAKVDQYYLNRVQPGQSASISLSGRLHSLQVSKVLPTVVNNQFEVLLTFDGNAPENIRRGQNLQVKLELSAKTKSLTVPRGAFYQSTGGSYAFVLDGDEAYKRSITLGSQNPDRIQVLNGLEAGEKIITSSYDAFKEVEHIVLID